MAWHDASRGHRSPLAVGLGRSADDAIDLFLKIAAKQLAIKHSRLGQQNERENNQILSLALWPSIMQIRKSLCSGRRRQMSPEKFDYFVHWYKKYIKNGSSLGITLAQLDLFHPSRPTPDTFLKLCREDAVTGIRGEISSALESNIKFKEALRRYSMTAIKTLRNQSRFDDAKWLESYAVETFGKGAFKQNESQRYPTYKVWIEPPEGSQDTKTANEQVSTSANDTGKG